MRLKKKQKKVLCYSCGSNYVSSILLVNTVYALWRCSKCSLVFTYPQSKYTQRVNEKIYDSQEELGSRVANFSTEYKRAKKHVLEFMKYKKSGRYLDVGCSYGIGLKAAKDLGFSVMGVEPAKKAADFAKKHYKVTVMQKEFEATELKSNLFDVVSLYDVLEHIPNIEKFLQKIRRVLKPGGLLVVQSPNIESYAYQLLKTKWNWLLVPNHVWHFSERSISKLLEANGFIVEGFQTSDSVYDFSSNLKSKIFNYENPNNIFEKIYQKLVYMACYVVIYLGSPAWSLLNKGGVFQVYAIKK